ncbi:MAG TPA: hypothetical protein VGS11_10880 [Candidatus Bathyarchaeia archaeon]|nr:hypothetical protein [Candidatus Bathyarchaeia archaeon]
MTKDPDATTTTEVFLGDLEVLQDLKDYRDEPNKVTIRRVLKVYLDELLKKKPVILIDTQRFMDLDTKLRKALIAGDYDGVVQRIRELSRK